MTLQSRLGRLPALDTTVKARQAPIPFHAGLNLVPKKKRFAEGSERPGAKPRAALSLHTELQAASTKHCIRCSLRPSPGSFWSHLSLCLPYSQGLHTSLCSVCFTCWEISPAQGLKMPSPHRQHLHSFLQPGPIKCQAHIFNWPLDIPALEFHSYHHETDLSPAQQSSPLFFQFSETAVT